LFALGRGEGLLSNFHLFARNVAGRALPKVRARFPPPRSPRFVTLGSLRGGTPLISPDPLFQNSTLDLHPWVANKQFDKSSERL
jgi:hypothetical protein